MSDAGEKMWNVSGGSAEGNRLKPWRYSKKLYKQRDIVECNFRNTKQLWRVFTRYDKLDETYNAFVAIANIAIGLKNLV